MAISKDDEKQRRKALNSGRGTKQNKKRVAEDMTYDWLVIRTEKLYQKLRTLPWGTQEYEKVFRQWKKTKDKQYELYDRG